MERYRFVRQGGEMRLVVEKAADVAALADLDEIYWLATSAPADAFACDPALTRWLDGDGDGRIRSADVKDAVRWLGRVLTSLEGIEARADRLDLALLDERTEEGKRLAACARRIRSNLRQKNAQLLLQDVRDRARILAQGDQNGDGIVPPDCAADDTVRSLALDVMATIGSVQDANGSAGVNEELLAEFLAEARSFLDWHARMSSCLGEAGAGGADPWRVVGEGLPLLERLGPKLDGYFDRCDALAYAAEIGAPPPAAAPLPGSVTEAAEFLERAPLAPPRADGLLDLDGALNPAFREDLRRLREAVLELFPGPGYDGRRLDRSGWRRVEARLECVRDIHAARAGERVARLGADALARALESRAAEGLRELLRRDREAGEELSALRDLEFVILAQRWLLDLANNFAALPDLAHPGRRTLLDAGRLVLDGQLFDFSLRVRDPVAHAAIAKRSGAYLIYSEVSVGKAGDRFHIVTPVIGRRTADVYVEKRGVFFDRSGVDYDARVVQVVENPTALTEAVAAPFRRLASALGSAVEKISSTAEKQIEATVTQATSAIPGRVLQPSPQAPAPPVAAPATAASTAATRVRDTVLTGGVTIAALGSSVAFITKTVSETNWRSLLVVVGAVLLVIMVPTVVSASGKLRRRDLSLLLEASGWATNGKIRVSRALRRVFSPRPPLPGERISRQ